MLAVMRFLPPEIPVVEVVTVRVATPEALVLAVPRVVLLVVSVNVTVMPATARLLVAVSASVVTPADVVPLVAPVRARVVVTDVTVNVVELELDV